VDLRVGGDLDMSLGLCRGGVENDMHVDLRIDIHNSGWKAHMTTSLSIGPYPRDNIDNTQALSQFPSLHSELPLLSSYPKIESANNTVVSRDRAEWAMSSQRFICGCQAQCKGLQKPVSLSTFNRHRKYRDAESFSTEFRGFLESSSAVPAPMGSQLEVIFYNNSSDSNLTELHMLWDAKIMDRNTIVEGNEVGGVGEDWEMEDSTEVRTWINI
jgi:hypothetical protein